ncbi:hypothetical protein FOZG_13499 [Fusarium oxysporum Fo47]|uniref:Uncharacterized protein n=1 Tax=Fusarium oxysporum Fo47 TaxID=660027 RepID=W9JVY3_FUSOX|nr:hypothetical protein FOZG_13499 [Fusarium oxysporum Fo47]
MIFNRKNHREGRPAADDQQVNESPDLISGLAMAAIGSQNKKVTADWCSTQFTRALAVESGCQLYNVTASSSQGIGCITLKHVPTLTEED